MSRIISGGTDRSFSEEIKKNHRAYARFRGSSYEYYEIDRFQPTLGELRPHWLKVLALKSELEFGKLPEGSWLVWLDDDMLIRDFEHAQSIFERYIETFATSETCLVTTQDCDYTIRLNSGVLMFKVDDCSRKIVDAWWAIRPKTGNCHHDDQAKLIELLNYVPSQQFEIAPQRVNDMNLNTFMASDTSRVCFSRDDDFASQPAGATSSGKADKLMPRLKRLKEGYSPLYHGLN